MKKIIYGIIILLIIAAISKPSEESFNEHMNTTLKVKKNDDLMSSIIKTGMNFQSNLSSHYNDRTFFSTVNTTIGNQHHSYLGLFGFWFEMN